MSDNTDINDIDSASVEEVFADVLQEEVKKEAKEESASEPKSDLPSGYMTKDAWVEAGKDPDEWVSPEVFKERTQRIKETSRLKREMAEKEREFENRIKNHSLLAKAQLQREIEKLQAARDEAIDLSDRDGVRMADKKIKELDKEMSLIEEEKLAQPAKPIEVVEWEEDNPWINDPDDPRTPVAQKVFKQTLESGKTIAYALRAAEKAINSQEEREIRKKPAVSMADSPRGTVSKSDSPSIAWSHLSREEAEIYDTLFIHTGMTKKDYLKAVSDERRGSK
jgi:hypothetical protein